MSHNVFADLGLENPELELKTAEATMRIRDLMRERKIAPADMAQLCGISSTEAERLAVGKPTKLSLAELDIIGHVCRSPLVQLPNPGQPYPDLKREQWVERIAEIPGGPAATAASQVPKSASKTSRQPKSRAGVILKK
jgi:DNA-binding Xre family transcriptional regulator